MDYSNINGSTPRRFSVLQLASAVLITALVTFAVVFHTVPEVSAKYETPALLSHLVGSPSKVQTAPSTPLSRSPETAVRAPPSVVSHEREHESSHFATPGGMSYEQYGYRGNYYGSRPDASSVAPDFSRERYPVRRPAPMPYGPAPLGYRQMPTTNGEYFQAKHFSGDHFHDERFHDTHFHGEHFHDEHLHGEHFPGEYFRGERLPADRFSPETPLGLNRESPMATSVRVRSTNICAKAVESSPACIGSLNPAKPVEYIYRQCEKGKIATTCACAAPGGGDEIKVTETFIRGFLCKCAFVKGAPSKKAFWTMRLGCKLQ